MATRDASVEDPESRHHLAEHVRTRRLALGLSVRTAADKAGVARGTWTALEEGTRKTADNNWAGVERSLGWEPGSIAAILSGGDPRITRAATGPSGGSAVATGGGDVTAAGERDEAVRRVMLNPDLSEDDKRRIAALLIEDERRAAQRRVERAEELIRLVRGED